MSSIMVRYGKSSKGSRKNTLVTCRMNETVFFGIARCSKRDKFDRQLGLEIANGRMQKALDAFADVVENLEGGEVAPISVVAQDGLSGWLPIAEIKILLGHFDNIEKTGPMIQSLNECGGCCGSCCGGCCGDDDPTEVDEEVPF